VALQAARFVVCVVGTDRGVRIVTSAACQPVIALLKAAADLKCVREKPLRGPLVLRHLHRILERAMTSAAQGVHPLSTQRLQMLYVEVCRTGRFGGGDVCASGTMTRLASYSEKLRFQKQGVGGQRDGVAQNTLPRYGSQKRQAQRVRVARHLFMAGGYIPRASMRKVAEVHLKQGLTILQHLRVAETLLARSEGVLERAPVSCLPIRRLVLEVGYADLDPGVRDRPYRWSEVRPRANIQHVHGLGMSGLAVIVALFRMTFCTGFTPYVLIPDQYGAPTEVAAGPGMGAGLRAQPAATQRQMPGSKKRAMRRRCFNGIGPQLADSPSARYSSPILPRTQTGVSLESL